MNCGEVLSRYVPPDFDPRLLPANGPSENRTQRRLESRIILPFTDRGYVGCGTTVYRGNKFHTTIEKY